MHSKKSGSPLAAYGPGTRIVVLTLIVMFIAVCAAGAVGGLRDIDGHATLDFMAPAWFVASVIGALSCSLIFVALLTGIIADWLNEHAGRREKRSPEAD